MNLQGLFLDQVWLGWNVKNIACNLLIIPKSTWGGGQLMVNFERICNDFGRITSDNVNPGEGVD